MTVTGGPRVGADRRPTHPARALTVLGTASQAPTRTRANGGCALRWDDQLVLFDPGEGFHRQCLLADVPIGRATAVCITHFHGDHCLGLAGVLQRRVLSQSSARLPVYYPAGGEQHLEHLIAGSSYDANDADVLEPIPVSGAGPVAALGRSRLVSEPLDHTIPTVGYRIQEPDRPRLSRAKLAELGLTGPPIGELLRHGEVEFGGERVRRADVGEVRPGQSVAYVMDTAPCDGAASLAAGADLLVCEATFLDCEHDLAARTRHLTARQAARMARRAGARRLVLTHFSGRYDTLDAFADEAGQEHDDVVIATDLQVVPVPPRQRPS